jgi:hypothetical protein
MLRWGGKGWALCGGGSGLDVGKRKREFAARE